MWCPCAKAHFEEELREAEAWEDLEFQRRLARRQDEGLVENPTVSIREQARRAREQALRKHAAG